MSTACGRPQGGGGLAHVDACGQGRGGGGKNPIFFVVHQKWMAPYTNHYSHHYP